MSEPQTLASAVWAALGTAVTIILGLVAVIYNSLKKDNTDLWREITVLRTQGKDCEVKQGQMLTEISTLKAEDLSIYNELDRLDDGQRATDSKLTTLLAEHNSCIPRRLAMKGMQQP